LFDEPLLAGATDQPSFAGILVSHFEETRGNDWSLDRLGKSSVDPRVVTYLKPRAEAAGRTFRKPKPFDGWFVLPARALTGVYRPPKLQVIASPIVEPEPNDNKYHAHVCKPPDMDQAWMALHLRHLFTTYGKPEYVRRDGTPRSLVSRLSGLPLLSWLFGPSR
jgi:hypothetical protein